MNRYLPLSVLAIAIQISALSLSTDAALTIPAVSSSVAKAMLKYFGKEGSQQATEFLTKKGGKEILERVTANAAKQGGDKAVQQVARLTRKYGPDALAALDNTDEILPLIRALDELPESQVKKALVKLSAGASGRELAEATSRLGIAALRSEMQHPGVGLVFVRSLGDDGAELASRLSTDQAIAIGRHVDDLAKLPASQRSNILSLMRNDTERVVGFVGRFVENNPGKTLFSVATTTIILAEPERILGGDEIVFDAEGNPIVVRKAGLASRTIDMGGSAAEHVSERYIRPVFLAIMTFLAVFAALWIAIKLWHTHQREQEKTRLLADSSGDPAKPEP